MGHNNIIEDHSARDKGALTTINNIMEMNLHPIHPGFGDNLVKNIAQADGTKVLYRTWRLNFRNQHYVSVIDL